MTDRPGSSDTPSILQSIRVAALPLGRDLSDMRTTAGVAQARLATDLQAFGFSISQQVLSRIENGTAGAVPEDVMDVWIRRCDVHRNDPRVCPMTAYRSLLAWYVSLRKLVPTALSEPEFADLALVLFDVHGTSCADISATLNFLAGAVKEFLYRRAFAEAAS